MRSIVEGKLNFEFRDDWRVAKYDAWKFYQNHFKNYFGGTRAVDIAAIDPSRCLWLIEVKDYRQHRRTKAEDLPTEIARKARDSLAGLLVARLKATEPEELAFAGEALASRMIRVVLHLEQPAQHSRLFPRAIDPAKVLQGLKSLVKPIDPHPRVVESQRMLDSLWQVR